MVRTWKYRFSEPLTKISERLEKEYGIFVTEAGLQQILLRVRTFFGVKYTELINDVRGSPVGRIC